MGPGFLIGKKVICKFVGQLLGKGGGLFLNANLPARSLTGVWESDTELILAYRRQRIKRRKGERVN